MSRFWTLDGHTPVPTDDIHEWSRLLDEHPGGRRVGGDDVGDWSVSTVFLGMDHGYGGGPPILFETMIFSRHDPRNEADESCWRYATWEEAEAGHNAVVRWLTADPSASGRPPEFGSEHE